MGSVSGTRRDFGNSFARTRRASKSWRAGWRSCWSSVGRWLRAGGPGWLNKPSFRLAYGNSLLILQLIKRQRQPRAWTEWSRVFRRWCFWFKRMVSTTFFRSQSSKTFSWTRRTSAFRKTWQSSWERIWNRWKRRRVTSTRSPTTWTPPSARMPRPRRLGLGTLRTQGRCSALIYAPNFAWRPQKCVLRKGNIYKVIWSPFPSNLLTATRSCFRYTGMDYVYQISMLQVHSLLQGRG